MAWFLSRVGCSRPPRIKIPESASKETAWNDVWGYDSLKFRSDRALQVLYTFPQSNPWASSAAVQTRDITSLARGRAACITSTSTTHDQQARFDHRLDMLSCASVVPRVEYDWRRPPYPIATADYATYVQILTWFLDTPSPEAPFSVHRMVLAGKKLGTDVGQWSGPSVAAGAIRTLTTAFPECGFSVAVANQVFAASHGETTSRSPRRQHGTTWGDRPVSLLLGIRLGIEGVNPIYYDTIKLLYTFPQSVGIAGGRPSSSYYFVGSQADNLFYLDPHNPRPAIPLRPPPKDGVYEGHGSEADHYHPEHDKEKKDRSGKKKSREKDRDREKRSSTSPTPQHYRVPTSPLSTRTGSSNFSYHAPVSPSPLQQQYSSSSADSSAGVGRRRAAEDDEDSEEELEEGDSLLSGDGESGRSPPPAYQQALSSSSATATTLGGRGAPGSDAGTTEPQSHQQQQQQQHVNTGRWRSASASQPTSPVQITKSHSATGSSSHHWNYSSSVDHHQHQHQHYGLVPTTPSDVESNSRTHAPSSAISGSANDLDPIQLHYCTAYSAAELKTFHCERVRKMPMSGLDSSMLIGFLVRDEKDWRDFRRRVGELPRTIFSVQDEAPTWPSDSDDNMGLESISEPDDLDLDDDEEGVEVQGEEDEEGDEGEIEQFFETRSRSASSASNAGQESSRRGSRQSEEVDTEEDPVGPMTPGPGSKFDIVSPPRRGKGKGDEEGDLAFRAENGDGFGEDDEEEESDIEDDWVDPSLPTPTPTGPPPPPPLATTTTASRQKPKTEKYAASSSSSPPSSSNLPPLAKGKGSSSATKSSASSSATTTKGSSSKKGKK
ncbi:hypothetical protein D9613_012659 [Agrocybe pediades]|uniref:Cysteine protease n=1 Tax=Agrocybe pediades TaxID=84607 RepID=A0A8H4QXE5_9AGAR|nr:hypothetical protein D9613_012659 [Agrocybe pediades]